MANVNITTNECAWAKFEVKLLGRTIKGLRGFAFKKSVEKEHLYAAGDEPLDIMSVEVNNDTIQIANADKIVAMYQKTLDDLQGRYEAKFREITGIYEEKIKLMQDEINSLKRTVKLLKEENQMLRQRLKEHNLE